jgi:hypothetical protein
MCPARPHIYQTPLKRTLMHAMNDPPLFPSCIAQAVQPPIANVSAQRILCAPWTSNTETSFRFVHCCIHPHPSQQ